MINNLSDLHIVSFPTFKDLNGSLTFYQRSELFPFAISRVFIVNACQGSVRGAHAHKICTQLLICTSGIVKVICRDSINSRSFILKTPSESLLIPPGIWAEQIYISTSNSMTVLCDQPYDPDDYIRDFDEFKAYRLGS